MGKSKKPPPPPDTSRYSDFAQKQSELLLNWSKQMYQSGQEEWSRLRQASEQMMGFTLPAMEESFGWARDMKDRFDTYVMPQMESLFKEAEVYSSKAEEQRQRGAAIQDVNAAMEAQRQAQLRNLESYGVDPSMARYNAIDKQMALGQAATGALAANQAGERTKEIGRNLRGQAIDVGSRFLDESARAQQIGGQIGTAGMGAGVQAAGVGAGIPGYAMPFMGQGLGANESAAGIVDTSYGRQLEFTDLTNKARQQDFNNYMAIGQSISGAIPAKPPGVAEGGPVSAPGGPTSDAGAIAISDGEYVVPADVVRKLGTNYFDKMIEKETGRPPPSQKQALPIPQSPPVPYQQTMGTGGMGMTSHLNEQHGMHPVPYQQNGSGGIIQ